MTDMQGFRETLRSIIGSISVALVLTSCADASRAYADERSQGTCEIGLSQFIERTGGDLLLESVLQGNLSGITEKSANRSPYFLEALSFASQVGTQEMLSKLHELREKDLSREQVYYFGQQAVLCSNTEALGYWLVSHGLDVNKRPKEGIADLMIVAIMNRDIETVNSLFRAGYSKCSYETPNGQTLLQLADSVGLGSFSSAYNKYCRIKRQEQSSASETR